MKQYNYPKGKLGEGIAAKHLQKKGYKILQQNFQTRYGELDLICTHKNEIIFVEVKLKIGERFGTPEEMVGKRKLRQVQRTAEAFLQKNYKYRQLSPRIDVVAIVLNEDSSVGRIDHYESVTLE
jgi:putative endonuclease